MINAYVVLVCFVAAIGGFLFGFDLVIIAGAQLSVTEYFGISEGSLTHGMVLGSASIGCIFGPFLGMFLCDAIGRRRTLFVAAVLFGVSAIGTALAWDLISLFSMRAVGGLGVGLASVASPMYIIEIAPPKWRGALGLMFQLAVCIGAVAAVVVAYYLARGLPDQTNWRWMFGSEMVGAVRGIDPTTGHYFDDTKRYVDALDISDAERDAIFEGNARRVFPRLDAQLKERGL